MPTLHQSDFVKLKCIVAFLFLLSFSHYSFGQRPIRDTIEIIKIAPNQVSKSRGQDPNISEASLDLCNTSNQSREGDQLISENSCLRIENTSKLTINIYLDGNLYSVVPPLGLLDGFVKDELKATKVYAVANFDDGSTKSWGPWDHQPMSCSMFLLE
jgi:hypothetical protein